MSKTKFWGSNTAQGIGKASNAGLDGYWDRILSTRLFAKQFDRIVLVDHSSSGKSVDGFRLAYSAILTRAYQQGKINQQQWNLYEVQIPMVFINVIDRRRSTGGSAAPPTPPLTVQTIATITADTNEGEIDRILADKEVHPRVAAEYPPKKWRRTVAQAWEDDPVHSKQNAIQMRARIKTYNENHGGLLVPDPPQPQFPLQYTYQQLPQWGNYPGT